MTEYFVLYDRDESDERLYDDVKKFKNRERAVKFWLKNLADAPILARKVTGEFPEDADYVIAAFFEDKYYTSALWEDSPVSIYEVHRCKLADLEKSVKKISSGEKKPLEILLGIEEKLVPGVLDMVDSMNTPRQR